jgi:catechol 2,3-dioxygenase-like lactoylglutathione lyase family enzyme
MAVQLNHTIVWCRSRQRSSSFVVELLGLSPATTFGPFAVVALDNNVSLDFHEAEDEIVRQHYAFLLTESEFDQVFERMINRGVPYWADPAQRDEGTINQADGGRGIYFEDPDGHLLEIITVPYGGS